MTLQRANSVPQLSDRIGLHIVLAVSWFGDWVKIMEERRDA
jgi:hypothetical protein